MARYWRELDVLVTRIQMPAEYKDVKVDVLCNDCETKSSDLPFHFYGVKCVQCSGYNTRILATRGYNPAARSEQQPSDQPIDPNRILEEALSALEGQEDEEGEVDDEDEDSEEMDEEDFELMDIDDEDSEEPLENESTQE